MGVVEPTEEEAKELAEAQANAQPDPNAVYLQAAAEEANAKAVKARADTISTLATADKTKAETIKTIAQVDQIQQQQALEVIDKFEQGMQQVQPTDVTAVVVDPNAPRP